jgi:LPXTG-site transpeptidase (sortase) family protein
MGRTDKILLGIGLFIILCSFLVRSGGFALFIPRFPQTGISLPELSFLFPPQVPEPDETGEPETPVSPTPTLSPVIYPERLIIPRLAIDAPVDPVGRTGSDHMDVPKDAAHVGWYSLGPTPSVRGNAVMTGHYDTPSGRPAVFYRLNQLAKGDTVIVVLKNGSRHEFVVTHKDLIPYQSFPSDYVFATKYGINLNLITCNGIWDREEKIYDQRLVIYATLKGTQFNTL